MAELQQKPKQRVKEDNADMSTQVMQKILQMDARPNYGISKGWMITFIIIVVAFMGIMITTGILVSNTLNKMHTTYINNVEEVITSRANIQATNDWERLPEEQQKSRLREQYYTIIRYYTNELPDDKKMNDEQILEAFDQLWRTTKKIPSINFFLPMAYMKVATNFNPIHNVNSQRGIAAFYLKSIEDTINLPLMRNDPVFRTVYRGSETANNPTEMMKVLVARIDNLMTTFRSREDWVILALFTNEYDVIAKYWNDGEGAIPDKFYKEGDLAETLKYFYAFKSWQIPVDQ